MSRFVVSATWDDNAPHLTPEARRDLWNSIPAYQKDARAKGIPQLGAGVIYPIADEDIVVDAFPIPDHYLRGYGLDVGWNKTAAEWRAKDPETGISYFYDEHYMGGASPEIHAAAIVRRGRWIKGRIDPAARGRQQADGKKLMSLYRRAVYGDTLSLTDALGVEDDTPNEAMMLGAANNAVETGLYDMLMGMQQGMLKVMRGRCPNLLAERRLYRRDEHGKIVKTFDHALDAARYAYCSGDGWLVAKPAPKAKSVEDRFTSGNLGRELGWMAN